MSKIAVANAAGKFELREEAVPQRPARAESDSAEAAPWWVCTEASVAAAAARAAEMPSVEVSPWERAMLVLIEAQGETCPFTKKTYREIYKDSCAQDIWNRAPNVHRKAAPPQEGRTLAKVRAHTKMILARNAAEAAVAEYVALGGNPNDEAQDHD
jgi:hypothetical protein